DDLAASMSRYLVDRITGLPNVEVLRRTNVTGLEGHDGILEAIRWRRGASGEEIRRPIQHLFLFIGAEPNTGWLSGSGVALDAKGFVLTGGDCNETRNPLETSRRGIFAIGDVRSGSIKRVAAAVGEGGQVVATVHATLAGMERKIPVSQPRGVSRLPVPIEGLNGSSIFRLTRVTRIFQKNIFTETTPEARAACHAGFFVARAAPAAARGGFLVFAEKQENTEEIKAMPFQKGES